MAKRTYLGKAMATINGINTVTISASQPIVLRQEQDEFTITAPDVAYHLENITNPHGVTKTQVGLGNVENYAVNDMPPTYIRTSELEPMISGERLQDAFAKIATLDDVVIVDTVKLANHIANKDNPHETTQAQVGLSEVENYCVNDMPPTYTPSETLVDLTSGEKMSVAMGKLSKAVTDLIEHRNNTSNPHSTTKAQVGLSEVENYCVNDLPPTYEMASNLTQFTSGESFSTIMSKASKGMDIVINNIPHYGYCTTEANIAAKTVTIPDYTLAVGSRINVKFANANTIANVTLNVNGTGAKYLKQSGTVGDFNTYSWDAGSIIEFIYDGTNYVMVNGTQAKTSVYGLTKLSNAIDSNSEVLAATPKAVKRTWDFANNITAQGPISFTGDESGRIITHDNSGVTAASKGDTSPQTPGFGGTFKVPSATVNATGHVTVFADHTVTIPSAVVTQSANGLMTKEDKKKLDVIAYGTCDTAAGTAAKVVTVKTNAASNFVLQEGSRIVVKFANGNTVDSVTINVNSTGAKSIKQSGTTGDFKTYTWAAGSVIEFIYDGTNFEMITGTQATTGVYGLTKLLTSTSSNSEVLAATPKSINDLRMFKAVTAGGTTVNSDNNADTLAFAAGNDEIVLAGNDSTDTVTISHGLVGPSTTANTEKGDTSDRTPGFGGNFNTLWAKVSPEGHVYNIGVKKVTLPSASASATITAGAEIGSITLNGTTTTFKQNARMYLGNSSATTDATSNVSDPFIRLFNNTTASDDIQIKADGTYITSTGKSGVVTIAHKTYTATTGTPTGNVSPGFGGTFTVNQIASDTGGHVTGSTSRTITIPSSAASASGNGLMTAADFKKINPQAIPANANLNNYTTVGWYHCKANATATTLTNCPTANAFAMMVLEHAGTYQFIQEYMASNAKAWHRNYYNGSWGGWVLHKWTDTTYSATNGISLSGTTFSNSGVRSISTGSSNGTISVNTNGTAADVSVKGLGSAAYTASTAYAASSHTHSQYLTSHQDISGKQDKLAVKGSATKGIYVSAAGTISEMTYSLNKTVPSDAVFTDTNTKVTSVGNHYTPSGGTDKTASGGTLTDITNSSSGTNVLTGVTVDAAGHVTGVKSIALKSTNTNTTYTTATATSNGLMSSSDKKKIDNLFDIDNYYLAANDSSAKASVIMVGYTNSPTPVTGRLVFAYNSSGGPSMYAYNSDTIGSNYNLNIQGTITQNGTAVSLAGHTHSYAASSHSHSTVTTSAAGFMSAADKTKLNKFGDGYVIVGQKSGTTLGNRATAEGYNTTSSSNYSHAEGNTTIASHQASHAEGESTTASGMNSHSEGRFSEASSQASHAEGYGVENNSFYVTALEEWINKYPTASGNGAHAEGYGSIIASGEGSHAEGQGTTSSPNRASGRGSHAEGQGTTASGNYSHAEGEGATASGSGAHAEGYNTKASSYSHAEGYNTTANTYGSHAEGYGTVAGKATDNNVLSISCHAEGVSCHANGYYSHAEGYNTTANTHGAHSEGYNTQATGMYSHAGGECTIAQGYTQTAIGSYNIANDNRNDALFIIGKGTASNKANAFRVGYTASWAAGTMNGSGADYAEMFEWEDGNPNNEDRRGLFVTLENDKIRLISPEDKFILGIVSGHPTVLGDVYDDQWKGMYEYDVFGAPIYEDVEVPDVKEIIKVPKVITKTIQEKEMQINPETNEEKEILVDKEVEEIIEVEEEVTLVPAHVEHRQKLNPNYDSSKKYIPRSERPEWSPVGMIGKLITIDDGSCIPNGWCKPSNGGIATISDVETKYRVMNRIDETHIQVFIRP